VGVPNCTGGSVRDLPRTRRRSPEQIDELFPGPIASPCSGLPWLWINRTSSGTTPSRCGPLQRTRPEGERKWSSPGRCCGWQTLAEATPARKRTANQLFCPISTEPWPNQDDFAASETRKAHSNKKPRRINDGAFRRSGTNWRNARPMRSDLVLE
jgi:hypothetical protein